MKMPKMSLLDWQKKYGTEAACAKALFPSSMARRFLLSALRI